MDNRAETMAQGKFDYGFAVQWMRKDLGIALEEARRNGAHLPVAALVDQFYSEVTALGGLRWGHVEPGGAAARDGRAFEQLTRAAWNRCLSLQSSTLGPRLQRWMAG